MVDSIASSKHFLPPGVKHRCQGSGEARPIYHVKHYPVQTNTAGKHIARDEKNHPPCLSKHAFSTRVYFAHKCTCESKPRCRLHVHVSISLLSWGEVSVLVQVAPCPSCCGTHLHYMLLLLLLSTLPVRHWRVYTEGRACSRCCRIKSLLGLGFVLYSTQLRREDL